MENARKSNLSEEFQHNLHTCKVQVSDELEKAGILRGFKQTRPTTEGCMMHIPSLETVEDVVLPRHHATTVLFQFGPLILITSHDV